MGLSIDVAVQNAKALDNLTGTLEKMGKSTLKNAKTFKELERAYNQAQKQINTVTAGLKNVSAVNNQLIAAYQKQEKQIADLTAQYNKLSAAQVRSSTASKNAIKNNRALNASIRGTTGALGKLWLSYGALVPLVSSFAAATVAVREFNNTVDFQYLTTYSAAIDGTSDSLGGLQQGLLDIGDTASTPTELASGLREFVKAGESASDVLGNNLLPEMSKFSQVAELGMAESIQLAVTQVNAFKDVTEQSVGGIFDYAAATDQMAKAVFSAPISFEDLAQSLKYTTELASTTGASFDEIVTGLELFGKAGIKASRAGTSFRTGLTKLVAQGEKVKAVFEAFGVDIADAFDPDGTLNVKAALDQFKLIYNQLDEISKVEFSEETFGLRAQAIQAVIAQLDNWDAANEGIRNSSGEVDRQYKEISETLQLAAKRFAAAFSRETVERLLPALDALGSAISGSVQYVDELVVVLVEATKLVGVFISAWALTKVVSGIATAVTAMQTLNKSILAANVSTQTLKSSFGALAAAGFIGYEIGKAFDKYTQDTRSAREKFQEEQLKQFNALQDTVKAEEEFVNSLEARKGKTFLGLFFSEETLEENKENLAEHKRQLELLRAQMTASEELQKQAATTFVTAGDVGKIKPLKEIPDVKTLVNLAQLEEARERTAEATKALEKFNKETGKIERDIATKAMDAEGKAIAKALEAVEKARADIAAIEGLSDSQREEALQKRAAAIKRVLEDEIKAVKEVAAAKSEASREKIFDDIEQKNLETTINSLDGMPKLIAQVNSEMKKFEASDDFKNLLPEDQGAALEAYREAVERSIYSTENLAEAWKEGSSFADGFKAGLIEIGDEMTTLGELGAETAHAIRDGLGESLVSAIKGDWDNLDDIWSGVLDRLLEKAANWAVDAAFELGSNFVSNVVSDISSGESSIGDAISKAASGDYTGAVGSLFSGGDSGGGACCQGMKDAIGEVADSIEDSSVSGEAVTSALSTAFAAYSGWDEAATTISENFSTALNSATVDLGKYAYDSADTIAANVDDVLSEAISADISSWTSTIDDVVNTSFVKLADSFDEVALESLNSADAWSVAADNASRSVSLVGDSWSETVSNFNEIDTTWIDELSSGVSEMTSGVKDFASGVKDGVTEFVGGAENLSTITAGVGAVTSAYGLYSGIKALSEGDVVGGTVQTGLSAYGLYGSAETLAPELVAALSDSISGAIEGISTAIEGAELAVDSVQVAEGVSTAIQTAEIATETAEAINAASTAATTTAEISAGAGAGVTAASIGSSVATAGIGYIASKIVAGLLTDEDTSKRPGSVAFKIGDKGALAGDTDAEFAERAERWSNALVEGLNDLSEGAGDTYDRLRQQIEPTTSSVETFIESMTGVGISSSTAQELLQEGIEGQTGVIIKSLEDLGASTTAAQAASVGLVDALDTTSEAEKNLAINAKSIGAELTQVGDTYTFVSGELRGNAHQLAQDVGDSLTSFSSAAGRTVEEITGASEAMLRNASDTAGKLAATSFDINAAINVDVDVDGDVSSNSYLEFISGRTSAFADGGLLEGGSGAIDDLYLGKVNGKNILAKGGEFIMNPESTRKYLPILREMNSETFANGGGVGFTTDPTSGTYFPDSDITAFINQIFASIAESFTEESVELAGIMADTFNTLGLSTIDADITKLNQTFETMRDDAIELGASEQELALIRDAQVQAIKDLYGEAQKSRVDVLQTIYEQLGLDDTELQLSSVNYEFDELRKTLIAAGGTTEELILLEQARDDALREAAASARDAIDDYLEPYEDVIAKAGLSDYEKSVYDINKKYKEAIDAAKELGATQEDLTVIEHARLLELEDLSNASEEAFTNIADIFSEISNYGIQGYVTGSGTTMHADGGIATTQHFIGEAGPEAILPLRHPQQLNFIEDKLDSALSSENSSNGPLSVKVYIGDKELKDEFRIVADDVAYTRQESGVQGRMYYPEVG